MKHLISSIISKNSGLVVKRNCTIYELLDLFEKKKTNFACIINEKDKILGVISLGDLKREILFNNKLLSEFLICQVDKIMKKKFYSLKTTDDINKAKGLILNKNILNIPIKKNNKFFGTITHKDLIKIT